MIECVHERKNNMFGSSSKLDVDSTGKIFLLQGMYLPIYIL